MRALRKLFRCRIVTVAFIGVFMWLTLHVQIVLRHHQEVRPTGSSTAVALQDRPSKLPSSQNKQSGLVPPPLLRTSKTTSQRETPLTTGAAKSTPSKLDTNHPFPSKPPKQRYPDMDKCKVVFRDKTMATCHMGAFGGKPASIDSTGCINYKQFRLHNSSRLL